MDERPRARFVMRETPIEEGFVLIDHEEVFDEDDPDSFIPDSPLSSSFPLVPLPSSSTPSALPPIQNAASQRETQERKGDLIAPMKEWVWDEKIISKDENNNQFAKQPLHLQLSSPQPTSKLEWKQPTETLSLESMASFIDAHDISTSSSSSFSSSSSSSSSSFSPFSGSLVQPASPSSEPVQAQTYSFGSFGGSSSFFQATYPQLSETVKVQEKTPVLPPPIQQQSPSFNHPQSQLYQQQPVSRLPQTPQTATRTEVRPLGRGPDRVREEELIAPNQQLYEVLQRYCQLARGAYASSYRDLYDRCGVTEDQVFGAKFQEMARPVPRPAYFVAHIPELRTLVLAIRGTQSRLELKIDAQCQPQSFGYLTTAAARLFYPQQPDGLVVEGFAHLGMINAARWFLDIVVPEMLKLKEILSDCDHIRLVGHSLGGGIAALIALALRPYLPSVKAFVFAAPACLTEDLATEADSCVLSLVNRSDLVPYLSHNKWTSLWSSFSLRSLFSPSSSSSVSAPTSDAARLDLLLDRTEDPVPSPDGSPSSSQPFTPGFSMDSSDLEPDQKLYPSLASDLPPSPTLSSSSSSSSPSPVLPAMSSLSGSLQGSRGEMCPPGIVLQVFKISKRSYRLRRMCRSEFQRRTPFSRKMFKHHRLPNYLHVIGKMLRREKLNAAFLV